VVGKEINIKSGKVVVALIKVGLVMVVMTPIVMANALMIIIALTVAR